MVMCAGFSRDTQLVKCRQKPQSIVKYDIMSIIDFQVLPLCIHHKYFMTGVEVWPDWDGTGTCGDWRVCMCLCMLKGKQEQEKEKEPMEQRAGKCVCVYGKGVVMTPL